MGVDRAMFARLAPGRMTLVEAEARGMYLERDVLAGRGPGRVTLDEIERRRWARRVDGTETTLSGSELPPRNDLNASLAALTPAPRQNPAHEKWIQPRGAPSELPYRSTLEALFGVSLGSVRAYFQQHTALAQHKAQAATWQDSIAFAGTPTLPLVAH